MQDYHRALILGGQTFGKGTVQTIQPLNHGAN
ncbi:S41 family peptidase [Pseudomonas aeruginosa]|nr:S41 family peptidase [Pseudomonas aeruginosa]